MPKLNMKEVAQRLDQSNISLSIADGTQDDFPLVYVNPAFCTVTGYDTDQMIGRNCRFLQSDLENDAPRAVIRDALKNGTAAQAVFQNRRLDGTTFNNLLIIEPLQDREGNLAYVVGAQFLVNAETRAAAAEAHGNQIVREIDKLLDLNERLRATSRQALARSMAAAVRLWMET
ncbi:PAS domain-containing protein [Loktanella sp. M215]|uniref:PAS domain-containing protein n=1 Tax=Loktanella sp. M215 TaxID=2675431 RepID=UPI001F2A5971|nr:PAS domain-containing protein [Loktanella sp. M215]MCF7698432.1 PAS domain-containing protein [Loktanella sp. M215]